MSTSSASKNEFRGKFLAATDGEVPPGARAPGGTSPSVTGLIRGDNYPNTGGYPNERIHKRLCAGWWLMFIGMFLIILAVSISTVSDIGTGYKKKAEQVTKCHQ